MFPMNYNGLEIDMLSIGDADCILVTKWTDGVATRVLVDGGNAGTVDTIRLFLVQRAAQHLDHVICSHPHDDHAAGLVGLIKDTRFTVGRIWLHQPWVHMDCRVLMEARRQGKAQRVTKILTESLETQVNLATAAQARGIPFDVEPFAGQSIGPLFVCGPTKEFYEALLLEFADLDKLAKYESDLAKMERERQIEDILEGIGTAESQTGLLDDPQTEPENDSATILWAEYGDHTFVFTSDAGAPALERATQSYRIGGCHWMQIPHHGSRRNITKPLIKRFSPKVAYVSADGNKKHPRRAVVNAFKENGAHVYSTHYPSGGHLWFHAGIVPIRADYSEAIPLWEA